MIKIENFETYGWEASIRGLRNPMNSWAKSDSKFGSVKFFSEYIKFEDSNFPIIGENDHDLMMRMNKSPEESKYRRMINVTFDCVAPLYWWKEFDAYKVGIVCNSCSTMHKIHSKEFTLDDFSHEHLIPMIGSTLESTINDLNYCREVFLDWDKNKQYYTSLFKDKKQVWWQMIQLLPTSYNQRRTIQLNYEVLAQIYRQRKNHKLDEWHTFCDWIESLPYSELITGGKEDAKN